MSKSKSILSCSGAFWAKWSASWAIFLATIILIPDGPSDATAAKFHAGTTHVHQALIAKLEEARTQDAGAMFVSFSDFDLSAHGARDFGDRETPPSSTR